MMIPPAKLAVTDADLCGTWKLVSLAAKDINSGTLVHPLGRHPNGFVCYGNDQRMMVLAAHDNRIKPARVDLTTPEIRDELFNTMFAYAGTFRVSGNRVEHKVEISWNETWTGEIFTREISFEDGRLVLTSPPQLGEDGRTYVLTAIWDKLR